MGSAPPAHDSAAAAPNARPLVLADVRLPTVSGDADALVIVGEQIRDVGKWKDLRTGLPSGTDVRDLAGATALPGLGDAHVHFTATGFLQTALDCTGLRTIQDLLDRVAREAASKPPGNLILGLRLEHLDFPSRRVPTLQELTAAAPEHPVYIRHITGHSSVGNARAFELIDFEPGQPGVVLDENGEPSGYLVAQATQIATHAMYQRYGEQVGYAGAFRAAAAKAAREGCTTVHALDDLEAVRTLVRIEPTLPVRVVPYAQTWDLQAVRDLGLPRIGGCHACALDGDFDMGTAAVLEPYHNRPGHHGVLYHDDTSLEGFVTAAHNMGIQVCFHAVGDRAVEQAITAFEAAQRRNPRPDPRHRIEHAQLMLEDQMRRAADVGAVLSVQPAFNHVWDHHTYTEYVGETHRRIDPLRSLLEHGLRVAGGSDSTVTELRPITGLHAAVNHSRREERIEVADAVRMFSEGVAFSTFDEHRRGRLEPGMQADVTVLDGDPFQVDPAAIERLRAVMTVVRGVVAHSD